MSQVYAPLNTIGDDDDDEIAFAPVTGTGTTGTGTTTTTATSGMTTITPPTYSYASSPMPYPNTNNPNVNQHSQQGQASSSSSTTIGTILGVVNSITDEEKQTLVMATVIPNTIRPPQVSSTSANDPSNKIVRQIAILFSGLIICMISAFDAFVFLEFDWGSKFLYIAGFCWALSTIALLIGTFYGAYVGQWRMLAPGIVLSHVASFLLRMVV